MPMTTLPSKQKPNSQEFRVENVPYAPSPGLAALEEKQHRWKSKNRTNIPFSFRCFLSFQAPIFLQETVEMQGIVRAISCRETLRAAMQGRNAANQRKNVFSRLWRITFSSAMHEKGIENLTVADVLMTKGAEKTGSWLWCHSNDTVHDAIKNMAENNIGSLVVLKPGEQQHIAGIITERDYMRKIIAPGRSSKYTLVGEIMTNESKLITVTSDTNILKAMQLMTDHHIRHAPVIDGKIGGMISIVDVVRAVVEQQRGELKRLNEFIQGEYF